MATKLVDLRVCGLTNPLGLEPKPLFSWRYETKEKDFFQEEYKVQIFDDEMKLIFDTGFMNGSNQSYEPSFEFENEKTYFWKAVAKTNKDEEITSEPSYFSTGLKKTKLKDFGAKMIKGPVKPFYSQKMVCYEIYFSFELNSADCLTFAFGNNDIRRNNVLFNSQFYEARDCYNSFEIFKDGKILLKRHKMKKGFEDDTALEIDTHLDLTNGKHSFEFKTHLNRVLSLKIDGVEFASNPPKTFSVVDEFCASADDGFLGNIGFKGEGASISDFKIYESNAKQASFDKERYDVFEKDGYKVIGSIIFAKNNLSFINPSHSGMTYFRKEFVLKKKIKSATAYLSAWGIYDCQINGTDITKNQYFNPGDGVYCASLHYNTYDVTKLLSVGKNCIGSLVTPGWWSGSYMFFHYAAYWGDNVGLLGKIKIIYEDGTSEEIVTDESWKTCNDGPAIFADFYDGEDYDTRKESNVIGYSLPGFDDTDWEGTIPAEARLMHFENPILIGKTCNEVHEVSRIKPLSVRKIKYATRVAYIYDFGINFGGICEFHLPKIKEGEKLTFRYAETLYPEKYEESKYDFGDKVGFLYTENLRGAICMDTYISNGNEIHYSTKHTSHGFRFLEISFESLSENESDKIIEKTYIEGIQLSSIEKENVHIETDNEDINKLFKNIMVTTYANHISIPTDCPQRDERLGWTGDLNFFALTDSYLTNVTPFIYNFEGVMCDNARAYPNYYFGSYAPSYEYENYDKVEYDPKAGGYGIAWPLAGISAPYWCYKQTGYLPILRNHYEYMVKFIDAYKNSLMPGCRALIRTGDVPKYGDWVSLVPTDDDYVFNACYVQALTFMIEISKALGEKEKEGHYSELRNTLIEEFNRFLINEKDEPISFLGAPQLTQSAYCLAIDNEIVSGKRKETFIEKYQELLEKDNYTMTSGFIGTQSLLTSLSKNNKTGSALKLFLSHNYPSWLYEVDQGAVSMWERWDCFNKVTGFQERTMNSQSHYAFGSVEGWFIRYFLGITNEDKTSYDEFYLIPEYGKGFKNIKASYLSDHGNIETEIKIDENGEIESYSCIIPPNSKCHLCLPESLLKDGTPIIRKGRELNEIILSSGKYSFKRTDLF